MAMDTTAIKERFVRLKPFLNERQRRLAAAAEAQSLGRGGISAVADATGVARKSIARGLQELATPDASLGQRISAFASIRRWWECMGQPRYAGAQRLLIPAEGGGGARVLLQRLECQQVVAKDQAVVENVLVGHAMHGVVGFLRVFQQDARLQLGPVLLADPGEFEFWVALGHG